MNMINDGGPAFPGQWYDFQPITGEQVVREQWGGMTLRDYFAAHAPVDFGMARAVWGNDNPSLYDDRDRAAFLAVWAMLRYEWADAMLKAREASND